MLREHVEQLELQAPEIDTQVDKQIDTQIDTEIETETDSEIDDESDTSDPSPPPWAPVFDAADDLDGLLHVDSPLLARAFQGRAR
jgi:hypothetical protein